MKFKVQIDGAEHEVEAGADGRIVLGGRGYEVKVSGPSTERRVVQLGDKTYEVRVVENHADSGAFVLELGGERIPVTVSEVVAGAVGGAAGAPAVAAGRPPEVAADPAPPDARVAVTAAAAPAVSAPSGSDAGAVGSPPGLPAEVEQGIWAPVPGKIVEVLVTVGDAVKEGDAVLILDAMKMENELRAPATGTVTAVTVKKGDQAERGQLLVALG